MASVTATPLPALGLVRLVVDYTPSPLPNLVHVYRITPDGAEHEVIGSPVHMSGGKAVIYDTTAPFDVNLTYRTEIRQPIVSVDDFSRTSEVLWGADRAGQFYDGTGGNVVGYWTNGSTGIIDVDSAGTPRFVTLPTLTLADTRTEVTLTTPVTATGGALKSGVIVRHNVGTNTSYALMVRFELGNVLRVAVEKYSPFASELGRATIGSYTPNRPVRIKAEAIGPMLRIKAWTSVEPADWSLTVFDGSYTSGRVGYWVNSDGGNSNSKPVMMTFDDAKITSLSPIGTAATSPTQLAAGNDGWVRDPQDPRRSIRLDNCATHTPDCLNASRFVFFQGLDDEEIASSTGVFEVNGSPAPLTVAQPRKSIATNLRVVSTTLADIPELRRLFSPGRDLVLSLPAKYGWGLETYGSDAFTAGDVVTGRLNRRDLRKPQRLWLVPIRVTDPDETYLTGLTGSNNIPVPGATYGDLQALGLTYSQLGGGGVSDTFTRTVSPGGWGTPEVGPAWSVVTGTASQVRVTEGVGRISQTVRNAITVVESPLAHTDIDVKTRFRWNVMPNGDTLRSAVVVRDVDDLNWVELEARLDQVVLNANPSFEAENPPLNANPYFEVDPPVLNTNPYFETNISGWSANTGEGTVTRSTAQAHEGVASLLLTPSGTGTQAAARSAAATGISPGQVLRAAAWLRCAVTRTVSLRIDWRDSSGTYLSSDTAFVGVAANTWMFSEVFGVAPANATQAGITVLMTGTPPAGNTLHVDEATLRVAGTSPWQVFGGTVTRSTAQAQQGTASMLLTPDGVSVQAVADSEQVPITAGTGYLADIWVRCVVTRTVNLGINWFDASGAYLSTSSQSPVSVTANTWTRLQFAATAPVGAARASVNAVLAGTPSAGHLLYIDSATLRVAAPSPWTVAGGTIHRSVAQFRDGAASMLLTPDGVTATAAARMEIAPTVAGREHRAGVWVRCSATRTIGVAINWYAPGNVFISSNTFSMAVTANTWTYMAFTATAPATTVAAQATVYMTGTPSSSTLLWIDKAILSTEYTASLRFGHSLAGNVTYETPVPVPSSVNVVSGAWYTMRVEAIGDTYRAKLWTTGYSEPGWQLTRTIGGHPSGVRLGVSTFASNASDNPTPEILEWDDFRARDPGNPVVRRTYQEWMQGVLT